MLEDKVRTIRKKAKSWLAVPTYYCAQNQIELDTLSQRLKSIYKSMFQFEHLRGGISGMVSQLMNQREIPGLKKKLMGKRVSRRIESRVFEYTKILARKALVKSKPNTSTLGSLVTSWAMLTEQLPTEFMGRVKPGIERLYKDWQNKTGCNGFSDNECLSHPTIFAEFISAFYRVLIQESPEEKLNYLLRNGISSFRTDNIDTEGIDKTMGDLIDQASYLITIDTIEKMESALKSNPEARAKITMPEFQALVFREEAKQGWKEGKDKDAIKILRESLDSDLKEEVNNEDEIIKSSIGLISRRGLLNNLLDALNGNLWRSFTEIIRGLLNNIKDVVSNWEFDTGDSYKGNTNNIRNWLFRR